MNAKNASYVMFGMLLLSVILFKLAPAALAGFLVSTLVLKLAGKIASHINVKFSKIIAVAVIAILVVSLFSLAGLGILHVFQGKEGLNALALQLVQVLQNLRQSLPESIASYIPESALGLKELSIEFLQEHSAQVGAVGVESLKGFAHVKLEYFINAKIVGHEVDAHAWELISAMLILEAILGVVGLILAPILYAYVKAEFKAEGLV